MLDPTHYKYYKYYQYYKFTGKNNYIIISFRFHVSPLKFLT